MTKCEHHDDFKEYFRSITDNIELKFDTHSKEIASLKTLSEKEIEDGKKKNERAFERIDELRSEVEKKYTEQKQTESYVKSLYRNVDQLIITVQGMVVKMDEYIGTVAIVKSDTDKNSEFASQGKKLVFEIIKWLIIFVLGYAIAK